MVRCVLGCRRLPAWFAWASPPREAEAVTHLLRQRLIIHETLRRLWLHSVLVNQFLLLCSVSPFLAELL